MNKGVQNIAISDEAAKQEQDAGKEGVTRGPSLRKRSVKQNKKMTDEEIMTALGQLASLIWYIMIATGQIAIAYHDSSWLDCYRISSELLVGLLQCIMITLGQIEIQHNDHDSSWLMQHIMRTLDQIAIAYEDS